jgi:splicing factor 3B subunit 1
VSRECCLLVCLSLFFCRSYTAPKAAFDDVPVAEVEDGEDVFDEYRRKTIQERESDYHKRKYRHMVISPERVDPFAGGKTPGADVRSYSDVMKERELTREEYVRFVV